MEAITAIFDSLDTARRSARELRENGIVDDKINFLIPGVSEEVIHNLTTEDAEQPGMGKAVGGVVGAAVGAGGGLAVASFLVPGVGPAVAIGIGAAALMGIGAVGGAAVGGNLEEFLTIGLPKDELYFYEDALRQNRTVVIVMTAGGREAAEVREALTRAGAESIDAARERWWVGLRDAEREHYASSGENFEQDENAYRQGFEAALQRNNRGRSFEEVLENLKGNYPTAYNDRSFRRGYERGLAHYHSLGKHHLQDNSEFRSH